MQLPIGQINKDWTLFLDRDGVINFEKEGDYIHTWDEFRFYDGALTAFKKFNDTFNRIIIVTNQRGVGKGTTKESDLSLIHANMEVVITDNGGRIDRVYYCSDMDDNSLRRKPNPGMGHEAVKDFPDIDLSKSLIVGNRLSDMAFGKNLGIFTVYLTTTHPDQDLTHDSIDASFPDLESFADALP